MDQLQRILAGKPMILEVYMLIIKINVLIFFRCDYFEWISDNRQSKKWVAVQEEGHYKADNL